MQTDPAMVALCDEDGVILLSSPAHTKLHQRPIEAIVGHNWREWTLPHLLPGMDSLFHQCLAGTPASFIRQIARPDGKALFAHMQMFAGDFGNQKLVVGTFREITVAEVRVDFGALPVLDYIRDISAELAVMSARSGLPCIERELETIAVMAGDVASMMTLKLPTND